MWKCCFLIAFLTFSIVGVGEAVKTDPYRKLGSTVELSPSSVDGPIRTIEWKHGNNIAVDWFGDSVTGYRQFKGCSMLNTSTGHLIIYNVTSAHNGLYAAEINGKIKDSTSIKVISPVPKPTVSTRCNAEKTYCLLTCEGSITDDNGPVNYSWTVGGRILPGNETLTITQENHEDLLGCQLENPVSSESSIDVPNPLLSGNRVFFIGPVVSLVMVVLVAVVVWRMGVCACNKSAEMNETNQKNSSEAERVELMTNHQTSAPNGTSGSFSAPEEQTSAGPETKVSVHQEDNNDTGEQTSAGPETKVTVHQEDSNDTGPEEEEEEEDDAAEV